MRQVVSGLNQIIKQQCLLGEAVLTIPFLGRVYNRLTLYNALGLRGKRWSRYEHGSPTERTRVKEKMSVRKRILTGGSLVSFRRSHWQA